MSETSELTSVVDTFHALHFKEKTGWRNAYTGGMHTLQSLRKYMIDLSLISLNDVEINANLLQVGH